VTMNGPGTIVLENTGNTFTGNITVNDGTVALGAASIPAGNDIILDGGTFSTGLASGFSETVTNLTLNSSSTLDFGTAPHQLNITALNLNGFNLTITGWSGVSGGSGIGGQLFAFPGAYSVVDLANITFFGFPAGGMQLSSGEIVPFILIVTPEPSSWLWGGGLAAIVVWHFWRRQGRRHLLL